MPKAIKRRRIPYTQIDGHWFHPDTGEQLCGANVDGFHCHSGPYYWPGTTRTNGRCILHGGKSYGPAGSLRSKFRLGELFGNVPDIEDSELTDLGELIRLQYARMIEKYDQYAEAKQNGEVERAEFHMAEFDRLRRELMPMADRQMRREEELGRSLDRNQAKKFQDLVFATTLVVLTKIGIEQKKIDMAFAMMANILEQQADDGKARLGSMINDLVRSEFAGDSPAVSG